jgi:hypothetical protein
MKKFYLLLVIVGFSACSLDLGGDWWSDGNIDLSGKANGKLNMDVDSTLHLFNTLILNLPSDPSNFFGMKGEILRGSFELTCYNVKAECTGVDIDLAAEEFTYVTFYYEDKTYQAGFLTSGPRGAGIIHIDEITDHSAKGSFNIDVVSETGEVIHLTNGEFDLAK